MALSTKPWGNISESDYKTAKDYADACLVNMNTGDSSNWDKSKCKLPVREPGGALNRNGMMAAQGRLVGAGGGVDLPADEKRKAAKKLVGLMDDNNIDPADSLLRVAGLPPRKKKSS